ncbi:chemotaxis protein CheW [Tahibacter amnicola]|uniref:Chemotaxis protein CheW n=1 Tax=Tahibacter amnicola TaxID=2976241 RepID=A0ABY6BFJ7_9GAMM|nr:chemotaxis protein CheW [Tahibacter amnicola]UXI68595.1 chemotaxis protein CheW [Tahibacter amnicola]
MITARGAIDDCWNRIGVRGDMSCPELVAHIHCRNCPRYASAAAMLLDIAMPSDYSQHWTEHVARPKVLDELQTLSVVLFRVGREWLALSTHVFREIASVRAVHSIPHRRNGIVLGLVNIRGGLQVCISLQQLLHIEAAPQGKRERHAAQQERLLVVQHDAGTAVFPVDEVHGIQRFHTQELNDVPATVARATATYTKGVLDWNQKTVGVLDEQLLFYTIDRSLASATMT